MTGFTPLTRAEKEEAFQLATSSFARNYAEEIECGMTDEDLEAALRDALGIFGGSYGPDCLAITYKGAGLKIWASHEVHSHVIDKPIFEGTATVKMAREVYCIPDPADFQMALF